MPSNLEFKVHEDTVATTECTGVVHFHYEESAGVQQPPLLYLSPVSRTERARKEPHNMTNWQIEEIRGDHSLEAICVHFAKQTLVSCRPQKQTVRTSSHREVPLLKSQPSPGRHNCIGTARDCPNSRQESKSPWPTMATTHARAKFTSPFAPLNLSQDEQVTLERLSRVIVRNYVAQYEAFQRESGGVVDERVWKPVKQREGVRVYVERKTHSDSGARDLKHTVESYAGSGVLTPPDLPLLLVTGSTPGTLDDLMFGLMGDSTEAVRIRGAYIDHYTHDTVVIATLATPSQGDPFAGLTLRWEHHNTSHGVLRPAVSDRDFVYMERTGLAYTSSGERLGFHLVHSVHFPSTPELPGLIRANTSVCGIYRTNAARDQVELYVRGITDAGGRMIRLAVVIASADTFVTIAKYMECAYCKKLMWRLRQLRKTGAFASSSIASASASASNTSASDGRTGPTASRSCGLCGKKPSSLSARRLVPGAQRLHACALCRRRVCASCRLKRTLSQVLSPPAGTLEQRTFSFCFACYSEVCQSDTLAIAQAEAAGDTKQVAEPFTNWSDSVSSSSFGSE